MDIPDTLTTEQRQTKQLQTHTHNTENKRYEQHGPRQNIPVKQES